MSRHPASQAPAAQPRAGQQLARRPARQVPGAAAATAARPGGTGAAAGGQADSRWPDGHPRRRRILLVLCLSLLVVVIDNTILNTALPTLARVLHAGTSSLQWITDAYTLCFAALLIPAGALGDRYGRRLSLLGGLAVFALGSTAAALASGTGMLIAARVVMGLGAAFVMPATLVDPERRLPAEGAPAGDRGLVGRGRRRHRGRPDARRAAAFALLVGQRLPGQRPAGGGCDRRRAGHRSGDRRARHAPARPARHRCWWPARCSRSLTPSSRPRPAAGPARHPRRGCRRDRRAWRVRLVGVAHRAPAD